MPTSDAPSHAQVGQEPAATGAEQRQAEQRRHGQRGVPAAARRHGQPRRDGGVQHRDLGGGEHEQSGGAERDAYLL
ncbi:hypothetical protein [Micromonospora sp. M42]|uniref:hypothetical protein n=1 Tax=Micromonospora sp. M42 TaxID=457406 RepID=UPI001CB771C5|nr:hypothetical protein [Micromonospora sp. M42]